MFSLNIKHSLNYQNNNLQIVMTNLLGVPEVRCQMLSPMHYPMVKQNRIVIIILIDKIFAKQINTVISQLLTPPDTQMFHRNLLLNLWQQLKNNQLPHMLMHPKLYSVNTKQASWILKIVEQILTTLLLLLVMELIKILEKYIILLETPGGLHGEKKDT